MAGGSAEAERLEGRRQEVDRRHGLVAAWLDDRNLTGVFVFHPDNFAWLTVGGRLDWHARGRSNGPYLYYSTRQRHLVASEVEAERLFVEELDGLGFQLKEAPPSQSNDAIPSVAAGAVAVDAPSSHLQSAFDAFQRWRSKLSSYDEPRFDDLGAALVHAIEAEGRTFERGMTERELAARLSHRLLHADIEPRGVWILADDRGARQPFPRPGDHPVNDHVCLFAMGAQAGLTAAAARTVSFGPITQNLRSANVACAMIASSLIRFSRPGETVRAIVERGIRIFAKTGHEFDWRRAPMGRRVGASDPDVRLRPDDATPVEEGMAFAWSPFIAGIVSADSVVVGADAGRLSTPIEQWPTMGCIVREETIIRPDILIR